MENTLKNKSTFFAQYWGQEVLGTKRGKGTYNVGEWRLFEEDFLILKDVTSITDEDAQKIGFSNSGHFNFDANIYGYKDELRLLGYAVDWADLIVEEMVNFGWIKLK